MQIKLRNKFYIKILLCFWLFGASLLISISFIAGQITLDSWVSPREKIFINSYAVVIVNSLKDIHDPKKYICNLNKKLKNTFFLMASNNEYILCKKKPKDLDKIVIKNKESAYMVKNYLVSDAVEMDDVKYRLVSIRDKQLYNDPRESFVGYRLVLALVFSALICHLISKFLTKPLQIVIAKMKLFAGGNFNARVGGALKQRKDEFSEIGTQFDEMADNIKDLMQSKQQMLYNISHELRSPLARQLMSLDILKITPTEEHAELIAGVEKENRLLNQLISEILMLAKLTTKTFSYTPENQNISLIIKKSIENINFEFQTSAVQFQGDNNIYAKVDKVTLIILIENLLKNAIKYSGVKNKIIINAEQEKNHLRMQILDQGPGINEKDLPFIFEPFKQSENKNKIRANDSGYGLGLAIAKEIVMLHGGTIDANNAIPSGLIITINIPFNY